jgi:hypothetical protein
MPDPAEIAKPLGRPLGIEGSVAMRAISIGAGGGPLGGAGGVD